ncbi:MAG TPA: hypothetical protein VGX25_16595, partial [Actinophytocola sp.]|nr:hypothetical protein [Actinophytocola sp.]
MELRLDDAELAAVDELADAIGRDYGRPDHPELLVEAPALACRLPGRIPHFLNRFRRTEAGHCLIRGHHVDQDRLGPTPGHWKNAEDPQRTLRFDVRLVLYSAVLGDVFGWATQQDGRIINDVLPIKGNETKQLGSASDVYMHFHTEDPFHEHRPDFVTLACLRNPDRTATTMGHIDDVAIDPRDAEVLFEPRFVITPDEAHLSSNNTLPHNAFAGIEELLHRPPPVAVLY